MITLVVGGSASGKSEYAEGLAVASAAPRYYVASMECCDEESRQRIRRHRDQRRGKGFLTIERPCGLELLQLPQQGGTVLLEDLSNLAANERYSPNGRGENALEGIRAAIHHLAAQCSHLIIVSNEIFTGGTDYLDDTVSYLRLLADANRMAAAESDNVCEVVCGLPIYYKGGEPI